MSHFSSHAQICRLWHISELANELGVRPTCVYQWLKRDRGRGNIPPWYWRRLISATERRHQITITFDQLALLTEHRMSWLLEKESIDAV